MPVEIDETELANLRRVATIADRVAKHPKARALMQQAVAEAAPEQVGPETRIRQEFDEKFEALRAELSEDRKARNELAAEREKAEQRAGLERRWTDGRRFAREQGYTEDGLKPLEDFMEKNGIADHKIAIPAFERENPPPPQVMTGGSRWNFFEQGADPQADADLRPLFEGREEQWLGGQIQRALADVRNNR